LAIDLQKLNFFVLVPKLQLGNADLEAPASSLAKLELRLLVPKLELGNQKNGVANLVLACTDWKIKINGKINGVRL